MRRTFIVGVLLSVQPVAWGGNVKEAEHVRLSEEIENLTERQVWNGVERRFQDLAKLGCPGALLSVVEMQVKKAAKRSHERNGEKSGARVGRRPTTDPRNPTRRRTTTDPVPSDVVPSGPDINTMSVFSVRRVKVLNESDTHLKLRIDGIQGGEDKRIPFTIAREKQVREQIRALELRGKINFVPEGRLHDLVQRELKASNSA